MIQSLQYGTSDYPPPLTAYLNQDAPPQLTFMGNELTFTNSLALLCSAKAPAGVLLAVHDLAQQWRQATQLVISGFQLPTEQEALTILLRPPGTAVQALARGISPTMRLDAARKTAQVRTS